MSRGCDAEKLPATLELNDIRKLGNRSCLIRGLILSRAKEDGEAQLAALELDDRRVACRHALERVVLYIIRVLRFDFGLRYSQLLLQISYRHILTFWKYL